MRQKPKYYSEVNNLAYNSMMDMMYGTGYSPYSSVLSFILNIVIILVIVGVVVALLNKSDFVGSGSSDRLTRVEKDVDDIKRMVEDIKNKLDEI
jgi:uncharacterized membrane protein (DUF106 family)